MLMIILEPQVKMVNLMAKLLSDLSEQAVPAPLNIDNS